MRQPWEMAITGQNAPRRPETVQGTRVTAVRHRSRTRSPQTPPGRPSTVRQRAVNAGDLGTRVGGPPGFGSSPAAIRCAALKGDGWLPQGDPRDRLPAQLVRVKEPREQAGIQGPFTLGAVTEPLHVGTPSWDVGRRTLSSAPEALAESLRAYSTMGVHQIQVRFRSRSRGELIDQTGAFGEQVAPLLP